MPRGPEHFRDIDAAINEAYGALRKRVRDMGYAPPGNSSGNIIPYALGYILEIIAEYLPRETINAVFGKSTQSGSTPLQNFVPVLVEKAINEKRVTAQEIVAQIENLERFKKFADHKRDNRSKRGPKEVEDKHKENSEKERPISVHYESQNSEKTSLAVMNQPNAALDPEFYEGIIRRISIERRERDPAARQACIAIHKCRCGICGFDFGKFYGPTAEGFIHVHHLNPLSNLTEETKVDPEKDLIRMARD